MRSELLKLLDAVERHERAAEDGYGQSDPTMSVGYLAGANMALHATAREIQRKLEAQERAERADWSAYKGSD